MEFDKEEQFISEKIEAACVCVCDLITGLSNLIIRITYLRSERVQHMRNLFSL